MRVRGHTEFAMATLNRSGGDGDPTTPPSLLAILLVEETSGDRSPLARSLRQEGYHVATASCLADARMIGAALRFDVVIYESNLSDGDGRSLYRDLSCRYPITGFVMSDHAPLEDIRMTLAAGHKAHLTRPFPFAKLLALLKSIKVERNDHQYEQYQASWRNS